MRRFNEAQVRWCRYLWLFCYYDRAIAKTTITINQVSSTSLKRVRKVTYNAFAYITNRHRLLVFVHPFAPEAGIQVPAGTVPAHERPDEAVLREAFEETGLSDLIVDCFLGEHERDRSDFGKEKIHHRSFYHRIS